MLRFGYNKGLPAGTDTAWGCRAIIDQHGTVDLVHDRHDAIGPDEPRRPLLAHLDQHVGNAWRQWAALLSVDTMDTRLMEEFALYEDAHMVVKGNTQGSGGYLDVCAYLKVTR